MASSSGLAKKRKATSSGSIDVSGASSSKSTKKSIESAYSLYMLDSMDISQEQENSFQVYSFRNNEWHPVIKKMTPHRYNFAVASYKGRIWVVGGEIGSTSHRQTVDTVVMFDPILEEWQGSMSMTHRRHSLCVAVLGDDLYAVGGLCDGTALNYVEVWRGRLWESCKPMQRARYQFAIGVAANRIYAVGGMSSPRCKIPTLEQYLPHLNFWVSRNTRRARGGNDFRIAVVNENMYGFVGGQRPRQITLFSPTHSHMIDWTRSIAPFPDDIHSYDVAALNGMVYLVGQIGRESHFASFNPDKKQWTTLEKPLGQDHGLVKIAVIRNAFES